jgi:hypothetical protein
MKVVHMRVFIDPLEMMKQLGLLPAPALLAGVVLGRLWNTLVPRIRWRPSIPGRTPESHG